MLTAGVGVVAAAFQEWGVWVEVVVAGAATEVVCWEAEAAPDMGTEVIDMAQQDLPAMSAVYLIGFSDRALSGSSRTPTCNPSASSPQGGWTTGGSSVLEPYPLVALSLLCTLRYRTLLRLHVSRCFHVLCSYDQNARGHVYVAHCAFGWLSC